MTNNKEPSGECVVGGCNNEICSDKIQGTQFSNCIRDPKYDCYVAAQCERQTNGECGWTQTSELTSCLAKFQGTETPSEGKFCGGIMGLRCPEGYTCKLDGNYPDAGGKCVKN